MTTFPLPPWRIDPYLVWAIATEFAYLQPAGDDVLDTVLIEARTSVSQLGEWAQNFRDAQEALCVIVAGAYLELPEPKERKVCTAQIRRGFLRLLVQHYPGEGDQRLPQPVAEFWDNVARIELSANVNPGGIDKKLPTEGATWVGPEEAAQRTVIGIVDVGCPYANDAWRSRVRALWDQNLGRSAKGGSTIPVGFGYGREWVATTSQKLIPPNAAVEIAPPEDRTAEEEKSYATHEFPLLGRRRTHGAAVLGELSNKALEPHAENAEIMIAELPQATVAYTARAALSAHVLDGVAWILQRGRTTHGGPQPSFVINVSMGTMAGPHDGTSLLETAFDELVEVYLDKQKAEHLAIVLAAGNSYESQAHTEFDLQWDRNNTYAAQLKWRVLPDDVTPSYVELWFPDTAADGQPCVTLTSPSGISVSAQMGTASGIGRPAEALVVFPRKSAGGAGLMALVALAPTASGAAAVLKTTDAGVWTIEVTAAKPIKGIHAYVERDTAMFDPSRPNGRQSYFLDEAYVPAGTVPGVPQDDPGCKIRRTGTLNSIATGRYPIVVGSYVHAKDKRPSAYSSCGPLRNSTMTRPQVVCVGDDALGQSGVVVDGTHSGTFTRFGGTSISAPQMAGMIAGAMGNNVIGPHKTVEMWLAELVHIRKTQVGAERQFPQIGGGRIGWYGLTGHPLFQGEEKSASAIAAAASANDSPRQSDGECRHLER